MSIVARSKYLKGVATALEADVAGTRASLNTLTELMQAARKDLDIAQAAADQAEKRFEQARQRVLDAYSHIGFLHTKLGVIEAQLQEVAPAAASMENALQRTYAARDIGRSLKGQPDRAAHYAAVAVHESMNEPRPSLSAVQGRIRQAVHGFSIVTPDPDDVY